MTTSTITMLNPYRVDSKLYNIFEFMKDGAWYSLLDITYAAYCPDPLAGAVVLYRRRTASALRTIRNQPGNTGFPFEVEFSKHRQSYRLFPFEE